MRPPDKPVVYRDSHGRLMKGSNMNPKGRPAGTSITEAIRAELLKIPEGERQTYLSLIVAKIFKKAIDEGDVIMLKAIWNYIDGMPKQNIEATGDFIINLISSKPK